MARTKQTARKVRQDVPSTSKSSGKEEEVKPPSPRKEPSPSPSRDTNRETTPSPKQGAKGKQTKQSVKRPTSKHMGKGKHIGKGLKANNPTGVKRKFRQQVRCLREIRKAVKALNLAIPKLPFQRVCRQIAERFKISMRWTRPALACMQEAAEDFLVEFFQDAYICSAHSHRVTLMDKDMIVLRRLRYRFCKVLEPVPFRG